MEKRFKKAKQYLLLDEKIPKENKKWIEDFFDYQETKLKRINHVPKLDEASYRTLYHYISYFKNVNKWFEYKPVNKWTEKDLKRVYNDLEDGKILNYQGKPFKDRATYYDKMFKSKPFRMIGLETAAKNIIEYNTYKKEEVSFITEEDFNAIISWIPRKDMRLLFWLLWDYGENINATLKLQKNDFTEQKTEGEPEFHVWWRKNILKRSRRERGEVNNYEETYNLLEDYLKDLKPTDKLFNFHANRARVMLFRALAKCGVTTSPKKERPSLKDFRSGMACDLLKKGWTREEVNKRLGHTPSSKEIDKYINFLAIESKNTKKKVSQFKISELEEQFDSYKRNSKKELQRKDEAIEGLKKDVELLFESQQSLFRMLKKLPKNQFDKLVSEDVLGK